MIKLFLRNYLPYVLLLGVLMFALCLHISIGAKSIPLKEVAFALWEYDENVFNHIVLWDMRLPRALVAIAVGASLSVAGALIQGITRNPLASPGILGVTHGASFVVVFIAVYWGLSAGLIPLYASIGGLLATGSVVAIAGLAGHTPVALILAGSAVTMLISSFTTMLLLSNEHVFENLRVWLSGSISSTEPQIILMYLPWIVVGLGIAFAISRQLTSLAMGEEAAIGLGVKVMRVKLWAIIAITIVSAASVSLAGPVGFVGLVIPHAVRLIYGYDYAKIVPYSALVGAIYLLLIDVISRTIISPLVISTGLVTTIVGAPLFVWLVRKKL